MTPPTYNAFGGVNNLPRITGTGGGYLTGSLPSVTDHTLFSVISYPTLANRAAFAGTNGLFAVNSGFAQFIETPTGVIARAGANAGLFATAVSNDLTTLGTGVPSIYSTAASSNGTVDLFINGVSKASVATAFALGACPNYVLLALDKTPQYPLVGDAYEYVLYNRLLTATERLRVHRYLAGRYGVTVP